MVNGKPQLVFGGVTAEPATSRQRAVARGGESFASYLPGGDNSVKIGQTGAPAAPGAQFPAQAQGLPQSRAVPPNARMFLGFLPDNYISTQNNGFSVGQTAGQTAGQASGQSARQASGQSARQASGQSARQASGQSQTARQTARTAQLQSPPPGVRSLSQAAPRALPNSRAMLNNFGSMGANQRLSAKTAPQLSGAPVTRRGSFGMVDTRRTATQQAGNQSARSTRTVAPGVASPPGSDAYTGFTANYGGAVSAGNRQSFVAHGFASKNAELAMKKLGYDTREQPSLQNYSSRLGPDPYALKAGRNAEGGMTFGSTRPVRFPSGEEGGRTSVLTASHRKKTGQAEQGGRTGASLAPTFRAMADQGLGRLAAKFESGEEGIAAIGFDRKGGTSYGKYQIASRVGTMRAFIDYLGEKAPDLAQRLAAAGPANTGGRKGRMPEEWRKIAAEDPERFEALQSDFIRVSHFEPAKQAIASATGVTFDQMPQALQEVLFSTAVQHGPAGATRIISQALRRTGTEKLQSGGNTAGKAEEQLITQIYNLRAGQFVSSTSQVQAAVRQRLKQEMREALQMLT